MNIAIVGATGNVGRKIIEVLHNKKISIDNLYFVASSNSAGSTLKFGDKEIKVENLENFDISEDRIDSSIINIIIIARNIVFAFLSNKKERMLLVK